MITIGSSVNNPIGVSVDDSKEWKGDDGNEVTPPQNSWNNQRRQSAGQSVRKLLRLLAVMFMRILFMSANKRIHTDMEIDEVMLAHKIRKQEEKIRSALGNETVVVVAKQLHWSPWKS